MAFFVGWRVYFTSLPIIFWVDRFFTISLYYAFGDVTNAALAVCNLQRMAVTY
jgi:hypothetical protein